MAIQEDPRSTEPDLSILLQDSIIASQLHIGLFRYDSSSSLKPYLVKRWSVSTDGKVYTFTLGDAATWHNGRKVRAADVKASWERALDPRLAAWGANYLTSIAGAAAVISGKSATLSGVQTPDTKTLIVTLERPDSTFLARLGATPTWISPPEAVIKHEPKWVSAPVGAGPYRFAEWRQHSQLVLKSADTMQKQTIQTLNFLVVPDDTTTINLFRAGQLDVASVEPTQLRMVRSDPWLNQRLHTWPAAQLIFLGLNLSHPGPLEDVRVRRAISLSINRELICHNVVSDSWTPTSDIIPVRVPGSSGATLLGSDPDSARKMLSDAGYPLGRGIPPLQFAALAGTQGAVAEVIAREISETLGIPVETRLLDPATFYAGIRSRRWDLVLTGWTADYLSADQWLSKLLTSGGPANFFGYSSPVLDQKVSHAMEALSENEQIAAWKEADRLAIEDEAIIPIANGTFMYLVNPSLRDFKPNLFGTMNFSEMHSSTEH